MKRWLSVILVVVLAGCGAQPVVVDGGAGGGGGGGGAGGGGGGGGGTVTATCVTASARLCDRAAACGGGTKFIVALASISATAEHMTLADCKNYYQFLACPSAEADGGTRDWAACRTAIDAAACMTTTKGEAITLPSAACRDLPL
jgi:hypothetical protein